MEPILKAQAELRRPTGDVQPNNLDTLDTFDGPMTLDDKISQAQAVGMMFGFDPLEVGKAIRKSPKPDIAAMREKLLARERMA